MPDININVLLIYIFIIYIYYIIISLWEDAETFKYEQEGAVLTGEDELLFVLEITGSCQRRGGKMGLSSGELPEDLRRS